MKTKNAKWWLAALGICLLLATLSPLASGSPDGLEKVAKDKGFLDSAAGSPFKLIADYVFPGVENEGLAQILAGWTGTLAIFTLVYSTTLVWSRFKKPARERGDS